MIFYWILFGIIGISIFYFIIHLFYQEWNTAAIEGFGSGSGSNHETDLNYAILYHKISYDKSHVEAFAQKCREICPDRSANVLIIGTRTGHLQTELAKYYTNILGQDDSRSMLQECKQRHKSLNTILMDPRTASDDSTMLRQYDLIICPDIYIYQFPIEDQRQIYETVHSYKKSTGYVILPMFDVDNIQVKPRQHSSNYIDESDNVHAITYYDQFVYDTWYEIGTSKGETWMELLRRDLFEMEDHQKKKVHTTRFYVERNESTIHDLEEIGYQIKGEWIQNDRRYLICF